MMRFSLKKFMKKNLLKFLLAFGLFLFSSQLFAQDLEKLKQQKESLKLNTELIEKKIDLLKEQQDNSKIKEKVEGLNNKSDRKTDNFSSSDSPESTAKDAKKRLNF